MFRSIGQGISKNKAVIDNNFRIQKNLSSVVGSFFKNHRHLIEAQIVGSDLIITTKNKTIAQHIAINAKELHKALKDNEINFRRLIIR
jgi:hypothetical protein